MLSSVTEENTAFCNDCTQLLIEKEVPNKANLFSENCNSFSLFLTMNCILYVIYLLLPSNFLKILRLLLHLWIVPKRISNWGDAEHVLAGLRKSGKSCPICTVPGCISQVSCAGAAGDAQNSRAATSHPRRVDSEGRVLTRVVNSGALCRTGHHTSSCTATCR